MQYLILGAKARALLQGRTHVTCEDIAGPGQARAAAPPGAELHRRERRRHARPGHRPPRGRNPQPRRRTDPRCAIPKDFCILRRSSGSRGWNCAPGTSSRDFSPACTAVRTSASRSSSASTASTPSATILRHIDWKVWAKQDRYYVKQFEEDTNLRCTLLVDVSGSMRYGRGRDEQVRIRLPRSPCSLAYLLLRQQDAVGCVSFDEKVRMTVPLRTKRNHLDSIIQALEVSSAPRTRPTSTRILREVAETYPRRGMMVLVSDLLVDRGTGCSAA